MALEFTTPGSAPEDLADGVESGDKIVEKEAASDVKELVNQDQENLKLRDFNLKELTRRLEEDKESLLHLPVSERAVNEFFEEHKDHEDHQDLVDAGEFFSARLGLGLSGEEYVERMRSLHDIKNLDIVNKLANEHNLEARYSINKKDSPLGDISMKLYQRDYGNTVAGTIGFNTENGKANLNDIHNTLYVSKEGENGVVDIPVTLEQDNNGNISYTEDNSTFDKPDRSEVRAMNKEIEKVKDLESSFRKIDGIAYAHVLGEDVDFSLHGIEESFSVPVSFFEE